MDEKLIVDVLGWIGGLGLVVAFYLNSTGRISSMGRNYQLLNFAAAIFLIINSTYYGAYPSAFVNVIWSMIAIVALWRIFKKN